MAEMSGSRCQIGLRWINGQALACGSGRPNGNAHGAVGIRGRWVQLYPLWTGGAMKR